MGFVTGIIDRWLYPTVGDNWDDFLFRSRIVAVSDNSTMMLDLGAGAGIVPGMDFRAAGRTVYGIDPDAAIALNRRLDEKVVGDGARLPFADHVFDVVFADNVLEHLPDPETTFKEVRRTLKPGGLFLVKTPNRRHYVTLLSRLTPASFHRIVVRKRGRAAEDVFPTLYRCNTPESLRKVAASAGLEVRSLELFESRPEYCRIIWPLYLAGALYERVVNRFPRLARYRVLLVASLASVDRSN